MDRCKKVGAYYCFYEKAYIIPANKLYDLKNEFEEVQSMKYAEENMNFKIEEFPMNFIKGILRSNINRENIELSNRLILVDQFGLTRYHNIAEKVVIISN